MIAFLSPSMPASRAKWHLHRETTVKCNLSGPDIDVAVIGGGIGGLAAAISLRQAGRSPTVFERSEKGASQGQGVGLWTNAWFALESLNVPLDVLRKSYAGNEVFVSNTDGSILKQVPISAFNRRPVEFRYVMRSDLLIALQSQVSHAAMRHRSCVASVREGGGHYEVTLDSGEVIFANAVVGADGVKSVVRESLGMENTPRYAGYRSYRGSGLASQAIQKDLPPGRVLQLWGVGERFGATLVDDERMHWFYTAAEDAGFVRADKRSADDHLKFVRERVSSWGCAIASDIAGLPQAEFVVNRCGDRLMLRSQWGRGACTLLGDAAHLSTPNLGQGAALALEDAVELGFQMKRAGGADAKREGIESAMRDFERKRWVRNLDVGVRSRAAGILVHVTSPFLSWARNKVLAPVILTEQFMLGTTTWQPPQS